MDSKLEDLTMILLNLWIIAVSMSVVLVGLGFGFLCALKKDGDSQTHLFVGSMWAVFATVTFCALCWAAIAYDVDSISRWLRITTLSALTNFMVVFSAVSFARYLRTRENRSV